MKNNQRVFLRLKNNIKHTRNTIKINNKDFIFDKIFHKSQKDCFDICAKDLVSDFLSGYNCTLLAYGQTGSGKTYTIQGTSHDYGILQRALSLIFIKKNDENVSISYVEIYNEKVYDLFSVGNEKEIANNDCKKEVIIREDPEKGIYFQNITKIQIDSFENALDVLYNGFLHRKTATTKMNIESSRSHALFTIYLYKSNHTLKKNAKFHIVDLAGSEKVELDYTDVQVRESCNINKSLLCLSKVIEKLSKNEQHINYRDSKLTFILKDCLGGNSKLSVIGNISYKNKLNKSLELFENERKYKKIKVERNASLFETLNTLYFLNRVKDIKNNPLVNTEFLGSVDDIKMEYKSLYIKHEKIKAKYAKLKKKNKKGKKKKLDRNLFKYKIKIWKDKLFTLKKLVYEFRLAFDEIKNNYCNTFEMYNVEKRKRLLMLGKVFKDLCKLRADEIDRLGIGEF